MPRCPRRRSRRISLVQDSPRPWWRFLFKRPAHQEIARLGVEDSVGPRKSKPTSPKRTAGDESATQRREPHFLIRGESRRRTCKAQTYFIISKKLKGFNLKLSGQSLIFGQVVRLKIVHHIVLCERLRALGIDSQRVHPLRPPSWSLWYEKCFFLLLTKFFFVRHCSTHRLHFS